MRLTHFERNALFTKIIMKGISIPFRDGLVELNNENIIKHIQLSYDKKHDSLDLELPRPLNHFPKAFLMNEFIDAYMSYIAQMHKEYQEEVSAPGYKPEIGEDENLQLFASTSTASILLVQIRALYHMWNFCRWGKRIYKVEDKLVDIFEHVDVHQKIKYFFAPYPEIYLILPANLNLKSPRGKPLEGAYISLEILDNGARRIAVMLTERVDRTEDIPDEEMTSFEFLYTNSEMFLEEVIDVNNWLDLTSETIIGNRETFQRALTFIVKFLLYISSANVNKETIKVQNKPNFNEKAKKFLPRLESSMSFIKLKHDIVISNKRYESSLGTGEGSKHSYRYMVRGHFHSFWMKKQPEGAQILAEDEDKGYKVLKFVQPFWKGPDSAEKVLNKYKIK